MQIKIHTYINMVKNIPTIERSTKIRFGKHVSDSQAENTIVFNASDSAVNATNTGSIYMAPLRVAELAGSNLIGYSASTKEVVDSSVPTSLLGGVTLQAATDRGNVTSNTVQFSNATTGFITTSNIGVANSAPIHALSVKDKVFMCGPTGDTNTLRVEGTTRSNKFTTGSSINIQDSGTNQIQVSGTIHSSTYTGSNLGLANTAPAHALSIGNQGQVQINVPTASIYALDTVGNVNAQNYRGDSYYLSNLTAENIVNQGNVTSNTVQFTNALTSIYTTSNVDVGGNVFIRESADALYGKIAGANTISASTVTTTSPIEMASGGTGQDSYADGTILYGKASGTALGTLAPAGSNADVGKYLKLGSSDIPEWSTVDTTLDAVLGSTTAESDGSMNLTDTGTTITTAGKIKAATFEGSGSDLNNINASNVVQAGGSTLSTSVLPTVPVTKGGTGLDTVTAGDILYANANDTIAGLDKGAGYEVLQMKSDATIPEWTSTITGATLSGPTLTGTITASGLNNNRIPFTNGSGVLSSDPKLTFDGVDTMTIGSNLTISGNLLVQGNTTYQHTKNHTIADPLIELGNANASDTIDLGMIMTRPTANVVSGFMGDEKKYVIAYTLSDPLDPHIVPTNATSDEYITLSVEGGNVSAGNVTTTGTVEATTLKGDGSNITNLDAEKITTGVLDVDHGGTNIASYTAGDLLYATGATTLAKLGVSDGKFLKSTASAVQWADVSSTLQAITDGGATTTHTIAFNNATTGLTSAGDISIASTKKLTFADDILLEGGSGTSNLKVNNAIILSPEVQGGSTSTKNVLSIDTTTGEIYDSGGQGGSTMEFTHEEGSGDHANVSIGKAAWAGPTGESNLTINTYGSNVLTVTGNVSATNITIGGLHVAASPFDLDDVCSGSAGSNVITSNVIQFTGPHASYGDNNFTTSKSISIGSNVTTTGNIFVGVDTTITGNVTSQNLQLTNTEIATTWTSGSGTLEIDCKNKSYGTAPLTSIDADVAILSVTNLPSGGQIVVPLLASGADRKVSKAITAGIDQIAFTNDVSIAQNGHGLLTVSKLDANIYMNAISFTAA
tara:strand:+ start:5676 stop:8900 length:3225 start_codon:yes stop_codon:yes gene_type:complete